MCVVRSVEGREAERAVCFFESCCCAVSWECARVGIWSWSREAARARNSGSLDPRSVALCARPRSDRSCVRISWDTKNCVSQLYSCYIKCLTSLIPRFYASGHCPPSEGRDYATFTAWERCECRNRLKDSSLLRISADVGLFLSFMHPSCHTTAGCLDHVVQHLWYQQYQEP